MRFLSFGVETIAADAPDALLAAYLDHVERGEDLFRVRRVPAGGYPRCEMEDSPDVYADTYPVFHPSSPPETEGVVPSTPVLRVVKGGGVGGGSSSGVPSGLNTPSSVASSQGLWGMPPRSRRSSRSGTPAPSSQGLLPAQRELADVVRNIWSWGNGGSREATPVMSSPGDAKVPSTPSVEVGSM